MGPCKLFISQQSLDGWLGSGRAAIDGEEMTDKTTGQKFRLVGGLRFIAEVTGQNDAGQLVGKVKDVEQIVKLGGEHLHDSVILGDNAYSVQEGFIGTPLLEDAQAADAAKSKPKAATIASLQAFFLNNVK